MATIKLNIPDAKALILLETLASKYGIEVPKERADKEALLNKILNQQIVDSLRGIIREQKQVEATQAIQADNDIAETELEAEVKARADVSQQVAEQPVVEKLT